MIGVGGFGGRSETFGSYLRLRNGRFVKDPTPGICGSHAGRHPFVVTTRDATHPIMAGLPEMWMHPEDELYARFRGPANNVTVLASAFSDRATNPNESGEHEPQLMTIWFGKGRVFTTTLGHNTDAMKCVGFATTFQRGAEWAATGRVTQKVPTVFPNATTVTSRP